MRYSNPSMSIWNAIYLPFYQILRPQLVCVHLCSLMLSRSFFVNKFCAQIRKEFVAKFHVNRFVRIANLKLRSMAEKSTEAGKGKQGQIEATFPRNLPFFRLLLPPSTPFNRPKRTIHNLPPYGDGHQRRKALLNLAKN